MDLPMDAILSGPCGKSGSWSPTGPFLFNLSIPYICLVSPPEMWKGKKGFPMYILQEHWAEGSLPRLFLFRAHLSFLLPLPRTARSLGRLAWPASASGIPFSRPLGAGTSLLQPFQHSEHQSYLCLWLIVVFFFFFFQLY